MASYGRALRGDVDAHDIFLGGILDGSREDPQE
ncbi:hypothetical protein IBTHAUMO2_170045 [Nitrosopumilaceae archaeon]|nr:hypothetical protein IBTHAUMO2_170045 [Nitrosopumilaceae archaeon]